MPTAAEKYPPRLPEKTKMHFVLKLRAPRVDKSIEQSGTKRREVRKRGSGKGAGIGNDRFRFNGNSLKNYIGKEARKNQIKED